MIKKNIDFLQAIELTKNKTNQAFFVFSSRCEVCGQFIPEAVYILQQYIKDNIYYIEADDMPFPPAEVPLLYLFREDLLDPTIRVGVAPKDLVCEDFKRFYSKI